MMHDWISNSSGWWCRQCGQHGGTGTAPTLAGGWDCQGAIDPAAPIRALPRPLQWLLAPILIWACLSEFAHSFEPPKPGQPVLAFWVTLLLFITSVVLSELLRAKPKIEDNRPDVNFNFPTATEGRVVPLLWGRVKIDGPNVVDYGDVRQDAIKESVKTGLWSRSTVIKGYRHFVYIQMALCRGTISAVKRVWVGDVEVFNGTATFTAGKTTVDINKPDLFGGDDLGNGGMQATLDIFEGSTTQPVSAFLDTVARQRITSAATPTAPRYTGTVHVVFRELSVPAASARGGYVGNSSQVEPLALEIERFPPIFPGQSAGQNIIGGTDCNPMNVLFEILTNDEWGLGFPDADIDVGAGFSFLAASNVLITEVNGFAMLLDTAVEAIDMIREVERQIDGVIFLDHRTGKWKVKLARDDYTIGDQPQVNETNSTYKNYTKGSWEDTTNQIQVQYDKRDDNYKKSHALAQDMANALIQGAGTVTTGKVVSAQSRFPGVKNSALAVNIAWRELRTQSFPLARATFVLDRSFWDLTPGEVFAWTDAKLGHTQLPMRVTKLDFGRLQDNQISVDAVQDVFQFRAASYGVPPATSWTVPADTLVAFPAAEQLSFEAPRALVVRDPDFGGDETASKVFTAGRRQDNEVRFLIRERHASGTPTGTFAQVGDVAAFMPIGKLNAALAIGTAVPTATITIKPDPDTQELLEAAFIDTTTVQDLGVDLIQLVLINNEFMLVQKAADNGANVDLQNVYRGVLDSVQGSHALDDLVYLIFVGAGLADGAFPKTDNIDVKLLPNSSSDTVTEAAATTIAFQFAKRPMRPYPPSEVSIDGTRFSAAVSLEGSGAGLDGFRNDFTFLRRAFQATDEVAALTDDGGTLLDTTNTTWQVELRADPDSANNLIEKSTFVASSSPALQFLRKIILHYSPNGTAGAKIRTIIRAQHDFSGETNIQNRNNLVYDYTPTSALTSQFSLGSKSALQVSASYTIATAGVHTGTIGTAFSTSVVQHRINGGSWLTLIAATATSGVTASLSVSDTLEIRHTVNDSDVRTFLEIKDSGSAAVAYGVLHAGQPAPQP